MKISGASLLCSLAWVINACGSAASYDYALPPPGFEEPPLLARIPGILAGEASHADPSRLRVDLVWFPVSHTEGKVQTSQNVTLQQLGWGHFEVHISKEPPTNAIEGAQMMRYAQAEVVLYEDVNDNKVLDVLDPGKPAPDRVLGRAHGMRVWWLGEGSPAPDNQRGYSPVQEGWSFTYGPIVAEPDIRDCEPNREDGTWKPTCRGRSIKVPAQDVSSQSNGFTLTQSQDPRLQSYACRGFWGTSPDKSDEWDDTTPGWNSPEVREKICNPETCDENVRGDKLDVPVKGRNVRIECSADQSTYFWKDCEPDPNLCGTIFCHYGRGMRNPKELKPSDWPDCSK